MNTDFVHVLICDDLNKKFVIRRRFADGREILYTEISYSDIESMGMDKFRRLLGENIIVDRPILRDLLLK
jgi:hypothetical protein